MPIYDDRFWLCRARRINKCASLAQYKGSHISEKHVGAHGKRSLILHWKCLISLFVSAVPSSHFALRNVFCWFCLFVKKTLSFIWYIFILMSGDLCRNEDLYLHEKLDGMFAFSLRFDITRTSLKGERVSEWERKKGKKSNDYKIYFLTILEMLSVGSYTHNFMVNKQSLSAWNFSMNRLKQGPPSSHSAPQKWQPTMDSEVSWSASTLPVIKLTFYT